MGYYHLLSDAFKNKTIFAWFSVRSTCTVEPLYNGHLRAKFSGRCKEVAVIYGEVFNKRIWVNGSKVGTGEYGRCGEVAVGGGSTVFLNLSKSWQNRDYFIWILVVFCQNCAIKITPDYPCFCTKCSYNTKRKISSEFWKEERIITSFNFSDFSKGTMLELENVGPSCKTFPSSPAS